MTAASKRILFVCEGNICRSPMAEWLANHALPGVRAESSGLRETGMAITPHSLTVLRERIGVDASSHASRNIGEIAAGDFDVIVALHPYIAGRLQGEHAITPHIVWDVPDPIGTAIDGYRVTYEQIERAMARLMREMEAIVGR